MIFYNNFNSWFYINYDITLIFMNFWILKITVTKTRYYVIESRDFINKKIKVFFNYCNWLILNLRWYRIILNTIISRFKVTIFNIFHDDDDDDDDQLIVFYFILLCDDERKIIRLN